MIFKMPFQIPALFHSQSLKSLRSAPHALVVHPRHGRGRVSKHELGILNDGRDESADRMESPSVFTNEPGLPNDSFSRPVKRRRRMRELKSSFRPRGISFKTSCASVEIGITFSTPVFSTSGGMTNAQNVSIF